MLYALAHALSTVCSLVFRELWRGGGGGGTEKNFIGGINLHGHAGATITLKYYGNEKLSPTRAMFASFSAKDNATMREVGRGRGGWKGPGFTGRCFVSGPFSRAKDTVNLKPVKLLFLTCSAADVTRVLFSYYTGGRGF